MSVVQGWRGITMRVRVVIWLVAAMAASSVLDAQRGDAPSGAPPGGGREAGPARTGGPGGGRGGPPPTPRAAAAFDLTGTWVAVVTEDWRWRMVTPPKNDVASVPLSGEGRKIAAAWDLDRDNASGNQCRAFGAAGIMRQPLRVQISWQDDQTLKLETDSGQQTRLFRFAAGAAGSNTTATTGPFEKTWQGVSTADWVKQPQSRGLGFGGRGGGATSGGTLEVVTNQMKSGYLRKNGVPYSEDTTLTEYYNRHSGPADLEWFTVTTVVEDPKYLTQPFITSSSFKREADNSKWKPSPCQTAPPTAAPLQPAGEPGR
jgi:hypothetical protein